MPTFGDSLVVHPSTLERLGRATPPETRRTRRPVLEDLSASLMERLIEICEARGVRLADVEIIDRRTVRIP